MKIYLISGEASGDLHGSNLIHSLKRKNLDIQVRAWGGDLIKAAGAKLVKHYSELAFMGFVEVAKNLKTILGNISFCKKDILEFSPDVLILIDYPGFNLRIAEWAKQNQIKVIYYISPQVWAWNSKRVKKIKRVVDEMIVILPFEKAFYKTHGFEVSYFGHPLMEVKEKFQAAQNFKVKYELDESSILLLMPGSRKQEIRQILPVMIEASKVIEGHQIVIAGLSSIDKDVYLNCCGDAQVKIICNKNYDLMTVSSMGWVSSGTATLEAALFGLPQVVCYKGNALSYQLAKRLVKIPYISLVNLIADEPLVQELIQDELTSKNLIKESTKLLEATEQIKQAYLTKVIAKLGDGNTSNEIAEFILKA